jgi:signal transduction histidine kinase
MFSRRLLLVALGAAAAFPALADPTRATPAEAQAMLARAIAYLKANGREKAFAAFSNKASPFVDRDLYVTAYDMNGRNLAHINPRMVGQDAINLQDADGRYVVKERLAEARAKGGGRQDMKWMNPVTRQIENKIVFFEKVDDVVLSCGAFRP